MVNLALGRVQGESDRDWEGDWATGGAGGTGGDCAGDKRPGGFGRLRG